MGLGKRLWSIGWMAGMFLSCAVAGQAAFAPGSYAYLLQADTFDTDRTRVVETLVSLKRGMLVLDRAFNGDEGGAWRPDELERLKSGGSRVVAYLSIGEAESYRSYWNPAWDADRDGSPDSGAPAFLGQENPDWKGNYTVKYWDPGWQALVLKDLAQIVQQGFDGVMMDIVDGFERFERDGDQWIDGRTNPETQQSYRADMIAFVQKIAATARQANPAFLVIPQNGAQLLAEDSYLQAVSGIALEDVFTLDKRVQPKEHQEYILQLLEPLLAQGKPAFCTEYPDSKATRSAALKAAKEHPGLVFLLTDRGLTSTGESFRGGTAPKR